MKKIVTVIVMTVLVFFMSTALVTTTFTEDAGAARRRSSAVIAHEQDERVITSFKTSVNAYILNAQLMRSAPSETLFKSVVKNNEILQDHSFTKKVNDDYTAVSEELQASAQKVTDIVEATQAKTEATDIKESVENIRTEVDNFNTVLAKRASAINLYNDELDKRNTITNYILAGVGVFIVGGIGVGLALARKRSKQHEKMLFANDPHASVFSADDRRKLAGAYEGLLEYERLYKDRNTTGMQNQKRTNYEVYRIGTAKDSLGKYRSVIFEYIGLIALSEGRIQEARQHLTKAKEFSGGVFYTETARNFPLS